MSIIGKWNGEYLPRNEYRFNFYIENSIFNQKNVYYFGI